MASVHTLSFRISLKKMPVLASLGHFWPVFGLLWPWFECLIVLMSIYFLVLSGVNEISKTIPNNNDQFQENADFGHFWPVFGLL